MKTTNEKGIETKIKMEILYKQEQKRKVNQWVLYNLQTMNGMAYDCREFYAHLSISSSGTRLNVWMLRVFSTCSVLIYFGGSIPPTQPLCKCYFIHSLRIFICLYVCLFGSIYSWIGKFYRFISKCLKTENLVKFIHLKHTVFGIRYSAHLPPNQYTMPTEINQVEILYSFHFLFNFLFHYFIKFFNVISFFVWSGIHLWANTKTTKIRWK